MKIENQEQYEQAVKIFEVKYFNDFSKAKEGAIDLELFYIKTHNDYNDQMTFLQEAHPLNNLQSFIQNWRYKNNSKSNFKTDFELLKTYCKENNQNLQSIAVAKAEFEAIQKVFRKTFPVNEKKIETPNEFFIRIQNDENSFCKMMPLKIPFEHFKVFTDKKNKNDNSYLSKEQYVSFFKRAFLNDKSIDKPTLNIGSREKLFVIKRFYEFYQKAIEFEKTIQCKVKYIKLVSDNFTNWSYKDLKNNFGNKVRKEW